MTNETTAPVQSLVDEVLAELDQSAAFHRELNTSNYDHDDVCQLNDWGVDACTALEKAAGLIRQQQALIAQQAAPVAAPVAVPDENGLLPCPFCGGKAELHQRETESLWSHNQVTWSQVGCHECECVGADCCEDDDGSEAVVHWNTRAADHAAPTTPAQQPRNRHGIDAHYFHKKLGLLLRDFDSLTPDELARSLARLAKVADEAVLSEPEFAAPPARKSQWVPELFGIDRVPDDFRNQASGYRTGWNDCRAAMLAGPGDTAAPEQAGPRLAISSQEQLAALLNGVQALHEISAELIAECVFEQMQAATGETEAPEQAEQPDTISVDRKDVELLAEFFEHENPHHLAVKALRVGEKFRALLEGGGV